MLEKQSSCCKERKLPENTWVGAVAQVYQSHWSFTLQTKACQGQTPDAGSEGKKTLSPIPPRDGAKASLLVGHHSAMSCCGSPDKAGAMLVKE